MGCEQFLVHFIVFARWRHHFRLSFESSGRFLFTKLQFLQKNMKVAYFIALLYSQFTILFYCLTLFFFGFFQFCILLYACASVAYSTNFLLTYFLNLSVAMCAMANWRLVFRVV